MGRMTSRLPPDHATATKARLRALGFSDALREIEALEQELAIAQDVAIRETRAHNQAKIDRDAARAERDTWELRAWRLGWDRE